jgi:hypothetical protein
LKKINYENEVIKKIIFLKEPIKIFANFDAEQVLISSLCSSKIKTRNKDSATEYFLVSHHGVTFRKNFSS